MTTLAREYRVIGWASVWAAGLLGVLFDVLAFHGGGLPSLLSAFICYRIAWQIADDVRETFDA